MPLRAAERFPALRLGKVDLLLRNTTWTLSREAGLGVLFAGVLLHDWQGLMVAADATIESPDQFAGATVCVEKGTIARSATQRLVTAARDQHHAAGARFRSRGGRRILRGPLRCAEFGRVDARRDPRRRAERTRGQVLAEQIAKQPLGPAVRADDDAWFTLVRWVLFALIAADEAELTQSSVATLRSSSDPVAQRVLDADRELSGLLGIAPEWSMRAVLSVGNYSEMFERNLGRDSPLRLERGVNRPWNRGGIMYAPPLQ